MYDDEEFYEVWFGYNIFVKYEIVFVSIVFGFDLGVGREGFRVVAGSVY